MCQTNHQELIYRPIALKEGDDRNVMPTHHLVRFLSNFIDLLGHSVEETNIQLGVIT